MRRRIAVVGPTGVGKTAFAVALAQAYNGELINADARQVLIDVGIGTAKPTPEELNGIACHCLDLWHVGEESSVHDWLIHARTADDAIQARRKVTILVGGTGLYVSSFVDGLGGSVVGAKNSLRKERQTIVDAGNLDLLVTELERRDPDAVTSIDVHNPRRVIRALELLDAGAPTLASSRERSDPRPALMIGIDCLREDYVARVRQRVDAMYAGDALVSEVEALRRRGISPEAISTCGIGYSQAFGVIAGSLDRTQAIEDTVARTLKYAKAQRTWWRRDKGLIWLDGTQTTDGLVEQVGKQILAASA